jgi:hypothetical protein
VTPPGGVPAAPEKHYLREPPKDGKGLLHLRFTCRRKEKILFDAEDAGKTAWGRCRCENRKGEAGPVVSAIIPYLEGV